VIVGRRFRSLIQRECVEIWRDRFRFVSVFLVPNLLFVIFSFGLTLDMENIAYVTLDKDQTPQSRAYLDRYQQSRFFKLVGSVSSSGEVERRIGSGEARFAIDIPAGFGRNLWDGRVPQVAIWIDGSMPFRSETLRGYVKAAHSASLCAAIRLETGVECRLAPVTFVPRYWFNQGLKSKVSFVLGMIAAILLFASAMSAALAVVREKEFGTIINFYTAPTSRIEYLLAKQLPYIAIGMINFAVHSMLAIHLFGVQLTGSAIALIFGALLYVFAGTGVGLVVSCFTKSQVAALLVTFIITLVPSFLYSGLLAPVSNIAEVTKLVAQGFPAMYFLQIAVGTFNKGLGPADFITEYLVLFGFAVLFLAAGVLLLKKQKS
jgi:ribosome-dependent ATPase